jgi:anti-sigma B factor antagonist
MPTDLVRQVMEDFSVQVVQGIGGASIVVSGELDIWSGPQLSRCVSRLIEDLVEGITVDVRNLVFIDSSGLHVLVGASKQAQATGIPFSLTGATGSVRRILELAGLAHLMREPGPAPVEDQPATTRRAALLDELLTSQRVPPGMDYQPLLRAADVAQLFEVSTRTVAQWARRGRIPYVTTPGGQRRYPADEIFRLLIESSDQP